MRHEPGAAQPTSETRPPQPRSESGEWPSSQAASAEPELPALGRGIVAQGDEQPPFHAEERHDGRHRPRARAASEEREGGLFKRQPAQEVTEDAARSAAAQPPGAEPPAATPPAAAAPASLPVIEVGGKSEDAQPKKRGWWQRLTE